MPSLEIHTIPHYSVHLQYLIPTQKPSSLNLTQLRFIIAENPILLQ
jgi:hypothetical protein